MEITKIRLLKSFKIIYLIFVSFALTNLLDPLISFLHKIQIAFYPNQIGIYRLWKRIMSKFCIPYPYLYFAIICAHTILQIKEVYIPFKI